jgi:phospholipid-binding lipoprotein MlaA
MRGIAVLSFAACLAAPSLASAQEAQPVAETAAPADPGDAGDPWEGFNRSMFAFHEGVDEAVVEPIARGYRAVTPGFFRAGVRNVLRNLRGPVIFANDVLQGEIPRAGTTAGRFVINSTVGVAGIFDPATSMGLERHDEDFGQTLAVWGVDEGPYIFVPLMGPTTVRDTFGRIIDTAFDPLSYAEFDEADEARAIRTALTALSAREQVIETIDDIRRDSLDPYVTIRTSYFLLRESAIQNGPADVQDLPEFEEIEETPTAEGNVGGEFSQQSKPIQVLDPAVSLASAKDVPTSSPK